MADWVTGKVTKIQFWTDALWASCSAKLPFSS